MSLCLSLSFSNGWKVSVYLIIGEGREPNETDYHEVTRGKKKRSDVKRCCVVAARGIVWANGIYVRFVFIYLSFILWQRDVCRPGVALHFNRVPSTRSPLITFPLIFPSSRQLDHRKRFITSCHSRIHFTHKSVFWIGTSKFCLPLFFKRRWSRCIYCNNIKSHSLMIVIDHEAKLLIARVIN